MSSFIVYGLMFHVATRIQNSKVKSQKRSSSTTVWVYSHHLICVRFLFEKNKVNGELQTANCKPKTNYKR